jgi:hypothetical protein
VGSLHDANTDFELLGDLVDAATPFLQLANCSQPTALMLPASPMQRL